MEQLGFNFDTTYTGLPAHFFTEQQPCKVASPLVVILNNTLASDMGLELGAIDKNTQAELFSGNKLPKNSTPFAQAYAGHQFGHFTMLGDGRAIIWGEHISPKNNRVDIQFKGSGQTPYSRRGDGKAVLGPMLREYIISEAMHNLEIPTTRSLAVVTTGESVMREKILPGAVLTRVASSHIRVGTFQFAAFMHDNSSIEAIMNYTIWRHYPELLEAENKAVALLKAVIEKQAELIVNWMRVGFIHGVMNTDNMTLSGETIDYGPCAFMDAFDPNTVFSSIDNMGRYAYANQPKIAQWNLARLAETLLPFIANDNNKAIEIAEETINNFSNIYERKWLDMMCSKLGIFAASAEDEPLLYDLLDWMHKNNADYTNTFRDLTRNELLNNKLYSQEKFKTWHQCWQKRLEQNQQSIESARELMQSVNPAVIPRNHKVEQALAAADNGDFSCLHNLLAALKRPYQDDKSLSDYQSPAKPTERVYQTYCGT